MVVLDLLRDPEATWLDAPSAISILPPAIRFMGRPGEEPAGPGRQAPPNRGYLRSR